MKRRTEPTKSGAIERAPAGAKLGTKKVPVTHPERVLFPDDGITKGDLIQYYRDVAHFMLPYLEGRPLTLQRWPEGIRGPSFFAKQAPKGMPDWIATTTQPRADGKGSVVYPLANDGPSLTYFTNLAAITFHVWMSRVGSIDRPDFILLDLDPVEACTGATLARVALSVRDELDAIGLSTRVKTTGGKGLHVIASLTGDENYARARALTEAVAERVASLLPDEVTLERSKAKRPRGTVYFDWAQVGQGKTLVPPYAVRARPGAPVSMPVDWGEVEAMAVSRSTRAAEDTFARWNLRSVPALLAERGDPWNGSFGPGQELAPALARAARRWGSVKGGT